MTERFQVERLDPPSFAGHKWAVRDTEFEPPDNPISVLRFYDTRKSADANAASYNRCIAPGEPT